MRVIKFNYSIYKGIKGPIIPIQVQGKKEWKIVWVYVDSGAIYSIFATEEAEALGIEYESGKKIMVVVGDGGYIPVYLHKLPVRIADVEIEATIGFSEKLGVGFNLLGRKDVFEKFKVSFSDSEGIVEFCKIPCK